VRLRRCYSLRDVRAPYNGFVVAPKFVALERDNKVGQIAFCDRDRSATHRLTTNWQLHWTGPPRTCFGLPGATAGLNSIESLMLNRAPGSGLVVWRRALASSAGRLPYNARCREFARSASGSTPSRCDDLPRATHCRVAETTGTRFQNQYGLSLARSSEALPASLWGRFPATNGSQAGLCRQH
jgi:hypothetical protein